MTLTLPENYPDPDAPFAKKHPVLIEYMQRTDYDWLKKFKEVAKVKRTTPVFIPVERTRFDDDLDGIMAPVVIPLKPVPTAHTRPGWLTGAIFFIVFLTAWTLGVIWTKAQYGEAEHVSSHAVVLPYVRSGE